MDLIAGFGHALDITARLKTLNEKLKDAEFAHLLADLQLELARIKSELAATIQQNVDLMDSVRTLKEQAKTNAASASPSAPPAIQPLDAERERVLTLVCLNDKWGTAAIAKRLGLSEQRAEFHLTALEATRYINGSRAVGTYGHSRRSETQWSIRQPGREYLNEHGLLD